METFESVRNFQFAQLKTRFQFAPLKISVGPTENFGGQLKMRKTLLQRLRSFLAFFMLWKLIHKPKQVAQPSKRGRKKEQSPRKPKKIVDVWDSPFGKMLLDSEKLDDDLKQIGRAHV